MAAPQAPPVPGILQARTLEWGAISFSNAWKWKWKVKSFSCVWLFVAPWTEPYQDPPSMGFSRQEYWSGVPSPSPNRHIFKKILNNTTTTRHIFQIMCNIKWENVKISYNRNKWKLKNKTDAQVWCCTGGQQHCVYCSAETQNLPLDTILMFNQKLSISTVCL